MRSDRYNNKQKAKKKLTATSVLAVIYILISVAFIVMLFLLNILPMKFMIPLTIILLLISLLIAKPLLLYDPNKKKRRVACAVLAVLFSIILGTGAYYLGGTMSFFSKIIDISGVQNFYVVAKTESPYDKLKDIEGQNVAVYTPADDIYNQAKDELKKKVEVDFEEAGSSMDICNALINDEQELIFVNSAYYDMAMEEIEEFTDETVKIIGKIDIKNNVIDISKKTKVTKNPFNIYITGIDTTGSISNVSRSDVNMIATVNPKTKKILLTSIPRDYYVELATIGQMDKLTHSGLYGPEVTVGTIENLLGIDINYYVKVNFTTVTALVNTLGGVDVNSDYSFTSRIGGYTFEEGMNHMNGEQALAFARERYSFASGDRQRVKNQQAVITAIIKKATGSSAILLKYTDILNAIDDNMQTSMGMDDITSLVKMQLGDMSGWDIENCSLDGSGSSALTYSIPNAYAYVMVPDQSTVDEAKNKIDSIMSGEDEE